MKIEKSRWIAHASPEEATRWSMALILPRFGEEVTGREVLADFYAALAEAIRQKAVALSCTVFSEWRLACEEDTFYSLVLDVLFYRGRDLVDCQRIADTRRWDGILLPPPRAVKRCVPPNGGWYFNGVDYILYQNTFSREKGAGVRRSAYGKFFQETVYSCQ